MPRSLPVESSVVTGIHVPSESVMIAWSELEVSLSAAILPCSLEDVVTMVICSRPTTLFASDATVDEIWISFTNVVVEVTWLDVLWWTAEDW